MRIVSRDAVSELVHVGLAQQNRSSLFQPRNNRRIPFGKIVAKNFRSGRSSNALNANIVFQRKWNTPCRSPRSVRVLRFPRTPSSASALFACLRANSSVTVMYAFNFGLNRSIRASINFRQLNRRQFASAKKTARSQRSWQTLARSRSSKFASRRVPRSPARSSDSTHLNKFFLAGANFQTCRYSR